jgi:hypothetical protein
MSYGDGPQEFEGDDPIIPDSSDSETDSSNNEITPEEQGALMAYINNLIDDPALKVDWEMAEAIIKMCDLSDEQMKHLLAAAKGTISESPFGSSPADIKMYLRGLNEKISNTLRRMKMKKD